MSQPMHQRQQPPPPPPLGAVMQTPPQPLGGATIARSASQILDDNLVRLQRQVDADGVGAGVGGGVGAGVGGSAPIFNVPTTPAHYYHPGAAAAPGPTMASPHAGGTTISSPSPSPSSSSPLSSSFHVVNDAIASGITSSERAMMSSSASSSSLSLGGETAGVRESSLMPPQPPTNAAAQQSTATRDSNSRVRKLFSRLRGAIK